MNKFKKENYIPILESSIIGMVAGLSAVLLSNGVNWLGALRVHLSNSLPFHYVLPVIGLVGGLLAGLLVEKIAPEASGSGIPQVRARLDRLVMALDFRIALVKLLGGTIALGSGFFLGREGPTVQLGAALAAPLARRFPTSTEHKRQLIAAGAGAGLTAAFNAPLAGITFVLEELLKETKPTTILITVVSCAVSCLVLNLLCPPHIRATIGELKPVISFEPTDLPYYLILGLLSGVLGAFFNKAIIGALNFNKFLLRMPITIKIGIAGMVSGAIISVLPEAFHNYAGMRALIVAGETNWFTVLVAFGAFFLLTLVAYGSGAPGGLFAPCLALGAALGYLVGFCEHLATGSGSTAAFALVGMGAFFSGVARTPLTAIVITFELTTNFELLVPLMLACVMSSVIGDIVFHGGLYDHLMRWNGIHLQEQSPLKPLQELKALDVMHKDFDFFRSNELLKTVLPALSSSAQRGFPVVENKKLVGVITQTDLMHIGSINGDSLERLTLADIMTKHPVAVSSHDTLDEIVSLFSNYKFTWLPVTYHDKVVGIILQSDVLKKVFEDEQTEDLSRNENVDIANKSGVPPAVQDLSASTDENPPVQPPTTSTDEKLVPESNTMGPGISAMTLRKN